MGIEDKIISASDEMYRQKLNEHGSTAKGLDWKDDQAQLIRFLQLGKLIETSGNFSIGDLGCGFGDFYGFLKGKYPSFDYKGYDILPFVIEQASLKYPDAYFTAIYTSEEMCKSDYIMASGIFNKTFGQITEEEWWDYIQATISTMFEKSEKGIAFNALTSYSDHEFKRADLYYTDPCRIFDFCKRRLSMDVALLHDYHLYDFTILVRK